MYLQRPLAGIVPADGNAGLKLFLQLLFQRDHQEIRLASRLCSGPDPALDPVNQFLGRPDAELAVQNLLSSLLELLFMLQIGRAHV